MRKSHDGMAEGFARPHPKPKRNRVQRVIIWVAVIILSIAAILTIVYKVMLLSPTAEASAAMQSDKHVTISKLDDGYRFEPAIEREGTSKQPNLIFYPGAMVEPESYSLFARKLAAAGYRVYIASMPLHLAFTDQDRAEAFIAEHPDESYVIGGHSLGGVFATRFAAEHREQLAGVFLLASYADKKGSLVHSSLPVLQITASRDGVLNWKSWGKAKRYMPDATTYVTIEGGNHTQFGSYGQQSMDKVATISPEQQLDEVSAALLDWIGKLNR